MKKKQNPTNNESVKNLIKMGCEITGGTAGAAAGFIIGGLPGAILGAAYTPTISNALYAVASELGHRYLSNREEVRIGATLTYAVEKIRAKLESGEQIRQDNFFTKDENNRSSAEEITEGVLIAAQREHEEKKLKYFGNLLANLAFEEDYDKSQGNYLIKTAQQLTYRQLCLLFLFANHEDYPLRKINYSNQEKFESDLMIVLQQIYDLKNIGLVTANELPIYGPRQVHPERMRVHSVGAHLYNLMELYTIESEEINAIVKILG